MSNTPRVIDAHVHIFPPQMIANRDHLLAIDPWFQQTYGHPKARLRTAEELITGMDKAGVDISIVVGWPWQHDAQIDQHNAYLAKVCTRYPDRLRWLAIFNPTSSNAPEQIQSAANMGARGFGELNADGQGFRWSEPDDYNVALQAVATTELPMMVHTSEPVGHQYPGKGTAHPKEILTAIEQFPDVSWVLAHWGGGLPFYELMPEVREACARVAYDSAATSYLYQPQVFRTVIDMVGVKKVLYGSDWPVLGQGKLLQRIRELNLTDEGYAAIVGGNAARIYGID